MDWIKLEEEQPKTTKEYLVHRKNNNGNIYYSVLTWDNVAKKFFDYDLEKGKLNYINNVVFWSEIYGIKDEIGLYEIETTVYVNGIVSQEKYKTIWSEEELNYNYTQMKEESFSVYSNKEKIKEIIEKSRFDLDYRKSIGLNNIGIDNIFGKTRVWCYNESSPYEGIKIKLEDVEKIVISKKIKKLDLNNYSLEQLMKKLPTKDFLRLINTYKNS